MNRTIDIRHEVSKLTSSKPVCAAAGAGALASETLRALPARIAKWRHQAPVDWLPGRANDYMHTARSKAVDGYAKLAERGKHAMNGHSTTPAQRHPNSKTAKTTKAK
jgi:hypothetical protein